MGGGAKIFKMDYVMNAERGKEDIDVETGIKDHISSSRKEKRK